MSLGIQELLCLVLSTCPVMPLVFQLPNSSGGGKELKGSFYTTCLSPEVLCHIKLLAQIFFYPKSCKRERKNVLCNLPLLFSIPSSLHLKVFLSKDFSFSEYKMLGSPYGFFFFSVI